MDYNDYINIFDTFNKNNVEYMIVGGTAVSYYGEYRKTTMQNGEVVEIADFDFWYASTYANYFNMLKAMQALGWDAQAIKRLREDNKLNLKKDVFRFQFERWNIDILPALHAPLNFRECFNRRKIVQMGSVEVPFISLEDLIADKLSLARPKDITDVENLRRNNPSVAKG